MVGPHLLFLPIVLLYDLVLNHLVISMKRVKCKEEEWDIQFLYYGYPQPNIYHLPRQQQRRMQFKLLLRVLLNRLQEFCPLQLAVQFLCQHFCMKVTTLDLFNRRYTPISKSCFLILCLIFTMACDKSAQLLESYGTGYG